MSNFFSFSVENRPSVTHALTIHSLWIFAMVILQVVIRKLVIRPVVVLPLVIRPAVVIRRWSFSPCSQSYTGHSSGSPEMSTSKWGRGRWGRVSQVNLRTNLGLGVQSVMVRGIDIPLLQIGLWGELPADRERTDYQYRSITCYIV